MSFGLSGIFAKVEPQLLRLENIDLDLSCITECFASLEFFPAESIRVTEQLIGLRTFIDRRIFNSCSRFACQPHRQRLRIFGRHRQLRVNGVKDKQPFVFDFKLFTLWQKFDQEHLLTLSVLQDDASENLALEILELSDFSHRKLRCGLLDQGSLLEDSTIDMFPSSAAMDTASEINTGIGIFGPIFSKDGDKTDIDEHASLSCARSMISPDALLLRALEDRSFLVSTIIAFHLHTSLVNLTDIADSLPASLIGYISFRSV